MYDRFVLLHARFPFERQVSPNHPTEAKSFPPSPARGRGAGGLPLTGNAGQGRGNARLGGDRLVLGKELAGIYPFGRCAKAAPPPKATRPRTPPRKLLRPGRVQYPPPTGVALRGGVPSQPLPYLGGGEGASGRIMPFSGNHTCEPCYEGDSPCSNRRYSQGGASRIRAILTGSREKLQYKSRYATRTTCATS